MRYRPRPSPAFVDAPLRPMPLSMIATVSCASSSIHPSTNTRPASLDTRGERHCCRPPSRSARWPAGLPRSSRRVRRRSWRRRREGRGYARRPPGHVSTQRIAWQTVRQGHASWQLGSSTTQKCGSRMMTRPPSSGRMWPGCTAHQFGDIWAASNSYMVSSTGWRQSSLVHSHTNGARSSVRSTLFSKSQRRRLWDWKRRTIFRAGVAAGVEISCTVAKRGWAGQLLDRPADSSANRRRRPARI
jgi:hypothetical protein